MKRRPNANHILAIMRDDDFDDPWGTAMSWCWAVVECLYDADPNMVPPQLGYRPSVAGPEVPSGATRLGDITYETVSVFCWLHNLDERDHTSDTVLATEDLPYWDAPGFAERAAQLRFAAICLDRYLDWCKAAGRSY